MVGTPRILHVILTLAMIHGTDFGFLRGGTILPSFRFDAVKKYIFFLRYRVLYLNHIINRITC